ncbi:hypothetical protein GCM10007161_12200 [Ignatzschineria indica]|nr:hypothetical protein GCM10007161_12200 [Ignatzschineria indica]
MAESKRASKDLSRCSEAADHIMNILYFIITSINDINGIKEIKEIKGMILHLLSIEVVRECQAGKDSHKDRYGGPFYNNKRIYL